VTSRYPAPARARGIFCNRTLNLRAIRAVGYDMDYTLIHYRIEEWERRAYEHLKQKLLALGWPVDELEFDPHLIVRGLILDLEHGNILKANRFGYVKRAYHGTAQMAFDGQRAIYGRELVDLGADRFVFLNTLFSLSEACMYAQLVDLLDAGRLEGVLGYRDLYRAVRTSIDEAHMEGQLKAEIIADPDRFVELDPELPLALLDQRHAGKKLLLITNSEWEYTRALMSYGFDQFLTDGMKWRDLFDLVIVSARKPAFFWERAPVFQVVNDEGLLKPAAMGIRERGTYLGGHATLVEEYLGVSGDEILYVGDHIYTDVSVSKNVFRWRTALVLRELEDELGAMVGFEANQSRLTELMQQKERLEFEHAQVRLELQRRRAKYGPEPSASARTLDKDLAALREKLQALDEEISPLAGGAGQLSNERWGLLMRAGNDKSHLARQVERYADIYMSRVSNFLYQTPYVYLRSIRGTLPHDSEAPLGVDE
jgi:HAD superfamily 5'-nucleotidase-like hydrolase